MVRKILETHLLPAGVKAFFLNYAILFQILLFPIVLSIKFFALLFPRHQEEHEQHDKEILKSETKFENFGYGSRILVGVEKGKTKTPKDIASSLSIFSHPK